MPSTEVYLVLLATILMSASNQIVSKSYGHATETRLALLPRVLKSLDKILIFFEQEFDQINLDAIFGLRITEGVLENILNSLRQDHLTNSTKSLPQYLTNLRSRVGRVILKTLPNLRTSNKKYFKQVGFVVEKKWTFLKPFKKLNPGRRARENDKDVRTNIGQSYQPCMVALFGSGGPGYKPCNVTGRCWQVMTRPDNVGYTLTHQALYFMFGKERGCSSVLSAKLKQSNIQGGIQGMYETICTSMYQQMHILENIKKKTRQQTDLYFEQSVVCGGLLGYTDFLSLARLDGLLRLQKNMGCYGDFFNDTKKDDIQSGTMRKILNVKFLSDGCESHITGVGSALLSIYLRWIILSHNETMKLRYHPVQ